MDASVTLSGNAAPQGAEQRLRRSESRFRQAQRLASLGWWEWDLQSDEMAWSDETYRILGLEPGSLPATYETFLQAIHPDDQANVVRTLAKAGKEDGPVSVDYRIIRPDGSVRHVNSFGEIAYDEHGRPACIVGVALDVTERQQIETEHRVSQERLVGILNMAHDAIIAVDEMVGITLFNKGAERIFGYAADEVMGRPLELLLPGQELHVPPDDLVYPLDQRERTRVLSRGGEVLAQRRDGSRFPAEVSLSRGELHGGKTVTLILRDITQRRRAEEKLRASEERFRQLIEGSLQGIVIHRNAKPLFVNQAFADIFGYDSPPKIMRLNDLRCLLTPDSQALVEALIEEMRRHGGNRVFQLQLQGIRLEGSTIHIDWSSRFVDWHGKLAIETTVVDVTQRTVLEEQLRQAQKMEAVGQLAGGVAHDFNNILQIVHGYTELALNAVAGQGGLGEYLERILNAAEDASRLIRQLMAISRREVLRPRLFDANALIADLMHMVRRIIGEDIDLEVVSSLDLAHINADSGALEQVLLNLCVNARDAMPSGGQLLLRMQNFEADAEFCNAHGWAKPRDYLLISISDTGTGMRQEVVEHIFEPFFTTKEAGKGTGLGLSMAYGIIRQHDGMIDVYSEPGVGTTFNIYLPLGSGAPPATTGRENPDVPGGRESILVAEDDSNVLNLVAALLESKGYAVLRATNGEEAVTVFAGRPDGIDLVMLDLVMPKLGGREVFHQMRALNPSLPVLFSTGYSADAVDTEFAQEQGYRVIKKPYRPNDLFRLVRETLDRSHTA